MLKPDEDDFDLLNRLLGNVCSVKFQVSIITIAHFRKSVLRKAQEFPRHGRRAIRIRWATQPFAMLGERIRFGGLTRDHAKT